LKHGTPSFPADWFGRESHGLLIAYCRHFANAKLVAEQLDALRPECLRQAEGLEIFDKLSKILDREQKAMSSLATRMRLSQQSRLKAETAATAVAKLGVDDSPLWG
jgi:hypothetical protein